MFTYLLDNTEITIKFNCSSEPFTNNYKKINFDDINNINNTNDYEIISIKKIKSYKFISFNKYGFVYIKSKGSDIIISLSGFYYKINNFPLRKLLILLKIKIFLGKKKILIISF